jgi:hypothetical protein
MSVLVVRAQEYLDYVGSEPFIGLPREEIERLHDAIPVLALARADVDEHSHLPLAAYAALHHNYAWITGLDGPGTLGKRVDLRADGPTPTFLDDALHALARHQLQGAGLPSSPCEWRLAGLLNHARQLSLVYVVRLHQRWGSADNGESQLQIRGNSGLRFARAHYDAPSQLIIDHLHAF